MRKQRAHAGLVLRVEKHELGLAIFERHQVVGLDLHGSEGIAISSHAIPYHGVVARIEQGAECDHGDQRSFHLSADYTQFREASRPAAVETPSSAFCRLSLLPDMYARTSGLSFGI